VTILMMFEHCYCILSVEFTNCMLIDACLIVAMLGHAAILRKRQFCTENSIVSDFNARGMPVITSSSSLDVPSSLGIARLTLVSSPPSRPQPRPPIPDL
jgi:hypothetical protein